MGALHKGHAQLIKRAQENSIKQNNPVLVSIFVNPLQFGPNEDFDNYPRDLLKDCNLAREAGANAIWAPSAEEIFPKEGNINYSIQTSFSLQDKLCGSSRPGHFAGVISVMSRLLQLVLPEILILGEKDWQQLLILRNLVTRLGLITKVKGVATYRENDGLAYSSRNQYLNEFEREIALNLPRVLKEAANNFQNNQGIDTKKIKLYLSKKGLQVEYLEIVDPYLLKSTRPTKKLSLLAAAVKCGKTRLIDHTFLMSRKPIVAIDGPAGAGKSTVTKLFASRLGLIYMDTGAMYRAVTWLIQKQEINWNDKKKMNILLSNMKLDIESSKDRFQRILVNNEDVTELIRAPEVTQMVSNISALAEVRNILTKKQKSMGINGGLVAEGRDIGTAVFPDAELKVFLTASVQERAKRRLNDLKQRGFSIPKLNILESQIEERDKLDSTRKISPLLQARDAKEVVSDGMSIEEVVNQLIDLFRSKVPEDAWPNPSSLHSVD